MIVEFDPLLALVPFGVAPVIRTDAGTHNREAISGAKYLGVGFTLPSLFWIIKKRKQTAAASTNAMTWFLVSAEIAVEIASMPPARSQLPI